MKREVFDGEGKSRGFYSARNVLNDLTGREWVFSSRSVIPKAYPPSLQHALRNAHGGQKPPELCRDLIQTFTKAGQWVLDPLMGVGGTLLGAALCGRRAVGIEREPRWIDIYETVCRREDLPVFPVHAGDCRHVVPRLRRAFDFILTDVPYWGMDKAARSRGTYKRVGEAARPRRRTKLAPFDAAPPQGKEAWLAEMGEVFAACRPRLKPKGYLAVFVGDMYHGGRYHFLSADLAPVIEAQGYTMKANLIWYDVSKSLHVYGYQYEFIPSLTHQNILIFRRHS